VVVKDILLLLLGFGVRSNH